MSWGAGLVNGIAIGIDVSLSDKNNADKKPVIKPTAPGTPTLAGLTQADLATIKFAPSTIAAGKIAKYVGKDGSGKTADLTVSGTDPLIASWQFTKPSQKESFTVSSISDNGVWSNASPTLSLITYPDAGIISAASYPAVNTITLTWKNNPNNGNVSITRWQLRLDAGANNQVFDIVPTESVGVFTGTVANIPAAYCGPNINAWIIAWNATGNSSINGGKAYPVNIPVPVAPGAPAPTYSNIKDTAVSVQFKEVTGTKPINYWADIAETGKPAVQQEIAVSYTASDVFGTINGLSPGTEYTISLYAENMAGKSAKSTGYKFSTTDSTRPDAPILKAVYPAKTSILVDYDYPQTARLYLEPKFYTAYAFDGTKTTKAEVYDPDEDMVIAGLTEGTKYDCWITATSLEGKEGPKSNVMSTTCISVIPAPTLLTAVPGDGKVDITWTAVTPGSGYTVDHYSFSAKNLTDPEAPNIEGHIVGTTSGTIALANDTMWDISVCAVCNPGLIPGDFSNSLQAYVEKPRVPYTPKITTAYAQPAGQIVVEWTKGVNGSNNRSSSGLTVDSWKVNFKSADGKGNNFQVDVPDAATMRIVSEKVTIGLWEVTVSAHNSIGWSAASYPAGVQYSPTKEDPFVGGVTYDDGTYKYVVLNSGATTGYEILRTATGANVEAEVLLAGAGGAGKGQTLMAGKGGDGGGGQLVITTLPAPGVAGSIFVTVPNGGNGKTGTQPENTTLKEGSTILEAVAGKTATDKNNGAGYPKQQVTGGWQNLNMFSFLKPGSEYVGGVAVSGEQNFPSATYCGEGGAGTKDSNPGKGGDSIVAIRWKK